MKGLKKKKKQPKQFSDDDDLLSPITDSSWGWFIVFCSFICNMIVDGLQYTFANLLFNISDSFESSITEVSLIGSLLSGFYNFSGPVAGALGNKFGFRMVCITGALASSFGLMISYFSPNVPFLYIFYGVIGGLGFGMIYMATVITTSLYFEKYRALAASLSVCGTGVGTFVFAPLGSWLVTDFGWRWALLVEGGIVLLCIACGWTFKPLQIIPVVPLDKGSPSELSVGTAREKTGSLYPIGDSKKTMANSAYPTIKEALQSNDDRRPTLAASTILSRKVTKESIIQLPYYSLSHRKMTKKEKCRIRCRVCCFNFWHCRCKERDLTLGDRPLYRDDIFYEGALKELPEYSSTERLNYHLSVTRIPAVQELEEHYERKCCVCHQAFIRACITMTGVNLLKSSIFSCLCLSSFMYTSALFIPYVFIIKLAKLHGIPDNVAVWMVSAIGISNTGGRLVSGIIKSFFKVNSALYVLVCLFISGLICFVFVLGYNIYIFVAFTCFFGFFTAPFISLRPVLIVEFLGLEKLTNAFGLVLLMQGVASIAGPPLAGVLEEKTENSVYVIYMAGALMVASGFALLASTVLHFRKMKTLSS